MISTTPRRSFADDIGQSPVIEQAQAAWKTWRELHASEPAASSGHANEHPLAPTKATRLLVIDEALAAWKAWRSERRHVELVQLLDPELIQFRVWIERNVGETEWHARVQQVI